jgi:ribosomal protein S18 acetylase RimI-like enzyme
VDTSDLDDAVRLALATHHAHLAEVHGRATRYHPDVSVFGAIATGPIDAPPWDDLAGLVDPGGSITFFAPEIPECPSDWTVTLAGVADQLLLDSFRPTRMPNGDTIVRALDDRDVAAMLDLVTLTQPGPFRPRTIELGEYWGVFDRDDRLVAMAGERMHLDGFTEISAVCTHPDARRRGLAAGLTSLVAARILDRNEQPFLHHAATNVAARHVYEELGFRFRTSVRYSTYEAPSHGRQYHRVGRQSW